MPLGSIVDEGWIGLGITVVAIGLAISCLFVDFAELARAREETLSAHTD